MSDRAYDVPLPPGIRSRFVDNANGLTMHVLEAGHEPRPGRWSCSCTASRSWPTAGAVMPALAAAGYHVIAPDQRGYGRTTGWDADFDGDLSPFRFLNLVRDALGSCPRWGAGGSTPSSGMTSAPSWRLVRAAAPGRVPRRGADERAVRRRARDPFAPPPPPATRIARRPRRARAPAQALPVVLLDARGRRRHAHCPQGLHDFLRAYFHLKSADWTANRPFPLTAWSAAELAKLPHLLRDGSRRDMAATVAHEMPSAAQIAANRWLPDEELASMSASLAAPVSRRASTGIAPEPRGVSQASWSSSTAAPSMCRPASSQVPATGASTSRPAHLRACSQACTDMRGCHLLDGAGHWVQQEQPEQVSRLLLEFLRERE